MTSKHSGRTASSLLAPLLASLLIPLFIALPGCMSTGGDAPGTASASSEPLTPEQRETARNKILAMRDKALQDLYRENPEVKKEIENAAGYAVIDTSGINLVMLVEANGHGVLVDRKNGKETFIRMVRVGTGPGLGYVNYRQILIFKNRTTYDEFARLGVDVGAQGNATFKPAGKGESLDRSDSFTPGLSVYQLTDSGVLVQANWGGTKYVADEQLN